MTVNIDNENRVIWYNTELNREQAQQYLDDFTFYIENVEIPEAKRIEKKEAILYFSKEKEQFYYEYIDKIMLQKPLFDTEIMMQSMTELELQNFEAQQERQMLAQQLADLELTMLERNDSNV